MKAVILPLILGLLIGKSDCIGIEHLKADIEQQSSYDIESAQDDPQPTDKEQEPNNINQEINNVKGQISEIKEHIQEQKEVISNPQEIKLETPKSEASQEQVIGQANGFNATFNVTKTVTEQKQNDKGVEKDKMTGGQEKKYENPGHSEGKDLKPKSEGTKKKKTVVHIVPYSKVSGFMKPVDDYYSGTNNMQQRGFVRMILEAVVEELDQHPDRRFTFSEVKYLQMWYTRASQELRDKLKKQIQSGQFEVATGGWSSSDEASPNFEDLINNIMIGHQFLQNEFNYTPKIGWNLDAFAHSNTNARIFAQLGFDAQFFTNIDQKVKDRFKAEDKHQLNFIWEPAASNFGNKYQILTSIFKDSHKFPGGFYADSASDVEFTPIVDDPDRSDYNAPDRANEFMNYVQELAAAYQEENIMYPMGTDFAYQNAGQTFKNIEKLLAWIEKNHCDEMITYRISTPSEYIKAINAEKKSYHLLKDDFMPFIDQKDQSFSGYFTSKAAYKKQIKDASSIFHSHQKQMAEAILRQNVNDEQVQNILKSKDLYLDALGITNDQYSIAGGLRDIVQKDDERRLNQAREVSSNLFRNDVLEQAKIILGKNITELSQCKNGPSNGNDTIFQCPLNDHKNQSDFLVIINNPRVIGTTNSYARVNLDSKNYKAQVWNCSLKNFVDTDSDIFEQSHYDYQNKEFIDYQMYIPASFRPGQLSIFRVVRVSEKEQAQIEESLAQLQEQRANEKKSASLSVLGIGPSNDILFNYVNDGINQTFGINLKYYEGHNATKKLTKEQEEENKKNNIIDKEASEPEGIWTLKPEFGSDAKQYSNSSNDGNNVVFQSGQFVDQYAITYQAQGCDGKEASAVVRVRFSPKLFEGLIQFDVELGTISIADGRSKDVTMNWKMYDDFDPKGVFWTDSNGLEMQKRTIIDDADKSIKVSRNYYPIDSAIAMRDQNGKQLQVTIMNNRPQGGSADLSDKANIEIMQHRRTTTIDKTLSADMALNETNGKDGPGLRINAEYTMQIFNFNTGKSLQREQQIRNDQPLEYFFSFDQLDFGKGLKKLPEPIVLEPKEEASNQVQPVQEPVISNKVIQPAPTYIKEISASNGVANPIKPVPVVAKKEPVVEKKEPAPEKQPESEETEKTEEAAEQPTKTETAQEKSIAEEIQSQIALKIKADSEKDKSLYKDSEDFKFAPVPLTKEDQQSGMLYHEDKESDVPALSQEDQAEKKDENIPEEALVQLSEPVDEVDDGTPNQNGQIDQSEEYDTDAAIQANENAQVNQEALNVNSSDETQAPNKSSEETKKANEKEGKTVDININLGGNETTQQPQAPKPVAQTETQAKIAKLLNKLPKYAKNVSISINPIQKNTNIKPKGINAKSKQEAQEQIEHIMKDLQDQMAEQNRERYPFIDAIDITKGNLYTKNFDGFTYQLFPLAKSKVLVRLENLLDKFDVTNSETKYFDIVTFAKELWYHSQLTSIGLNQPQAHITEMSLNGVSPVEKSREQLKWINSEACANAEEVQDKNALKGVALPPQSIRTFVIDYSDPVAPKEEAKIRPVERVLRRVAEKRAAEQTNSGKETKQNSTKQTEAKTEEAPKAQPKQGSNSKQVNIVLDLSKSDNDGGKPSIKVVQPTNAKESTVSQDANQEPKKEEDAKSQMPETKHSPKANREATPTKAAQTWKEVKLDKYTPLKQQLKQLKNKKK